MLTIETLGSEEAAAAIEAGIKAATETGRPMAFVVVDHAGEIIACHRMDGAHPRLLRHALRKAYTSAVMGRNTLSFKADLAQRDGNLDQWGDRRLTTLQGGMVVRKDGTPVGAVAAGGGTIAGDEEVAKLMVRAMGFEPVDDPRLAGKRG